MTKENLGWLDATAQAELIARGEVTPLELVEAAIARIERLNPELNCVIFKRYEKARAEAASISAGPFRGVPFLMKDLVQTHAGEPQSWGWSAFKQAGVTAPLTSHVTAKLRQAGFIILAQTTVPEWGSSITTETETWGPTRNPWNTGHSTGGSSGGSAAAVASGMVPAAHGNDAGGSIRIPASECGLVGLKASRGRVSLGPHFGEMWQGACTDGVLTRSVRDHAAILDAIQGYMPGDPYVAPAPQRPYEREISRKPGKLRIGFTDRTRVANQPVHPECAAAVAFALKLLESLGHSVEPSFPKALDDPSFDSNFGRLVAAHQAATAIAVEKILGRAVGREDFEDWTWFLIERGRRVSASDYIAACDWINTFTRGVAEWWSKGFDILVSPMLPAPPPPLGSFKVGPGETVLDVGRRINEMSPFAPVWNVTGQPAISLPLHLSASGLPIGVQFVAAYGREDLLFQLAAQLEKAAPWDQRRPAVHA